MDMDIIMFTQEYEKIFKTIFTRNGELFTPDLMSGEEKRKYYKICEKWFNGNNLMFNILLGISVDPVPPFDLENLDSPNNHITYMHIYSISYNVYAAVMRVRGKTVPAYLRPNTGELPCVF